VLSHLSPTGNEFLLPCTDISADNSAPFAWREAVVIPILKPGKDCSLRTSYRPIILTAFVRPWNIMVNYPIFWLWNTEICFKMVYSGAIDPLERCVQNCFFMCQHLVTVFFDLEVYDTMWLCYILRSLHRWNLWDQLPLFLLTFLQGCPFHICLTSVLLFVLLIIKWSLTRIGFKSHPICCCDQGNQHSWSICLNITVCS
jgi:hypothetical protein